jgi:hypothetical protein
MGKAVYQGEKPDEPEGEIVMDDVEVLETA